MTPLLAVLLWLTNFWCPASDHFSRPECCNSRKAPLSCWFHPLHLAGLQANRRIVTGLLSVPLLGPLMPVLPSAHTCPATRRRPGSGPRRQRISWRCFDTPPPSGPRTPPRNSRLASSALSSRFLGRLKAKPSRCSQFRQLLRLRLMPHRSQTNRFTTLQFQLAISIPAASGNPSIELLEIPISGDSRP